MGRILSRREILGVMIGAKAALCLSVFAKVDFLASSTVTPNEEKPVYSIFSIRGKGDMVSLRHYKPEQRLINYVPANEANQNWFNEHVALREKFSREGKLLGVSKYVVGDELIIVNQWRKASDFEEFCRQTNINQLLIQLDDKFTYSYRLNSILPAHLASSKPVVQAYA